MSSIELRSFPMYKKVIADATMIEMILHASTLSRLSLRVMLLNVFGI